MGLQYTWVATSVGWVLKTAPSPNGYQGGVLGRKFSILWKILWKKKINYKFPLFGKKKKKRIFFCQNSSQLTTTWKVLKIFLLYILKITKFDLILLWIWWSLEQYHKFEGRKKKNTLVSVTPHSLEQLGAFCRQTKCKKKSFQGDKFWAKFMFCRESTAPLALKQGLVALY